MKKCMAHVFVIVLLNFLFFQGKAQNQYSLVLNVKNQPDQMVYLVSVAGDKTAIVDSVKPLDGKITFQFSRNALPGMYKVILGQTLYSKVMDQPPQVLDLIYNFENIELGTDFKAPEDSIKIIKSGENKVWFGFRHFETEYQQSKKFLEDELFGCEEKKNHKGDPKIEDLLSGSGRCSGFVLEYNSLQLKRDSTIKALVKKYPGMYATKLIKNYCEPFIDGVLSANERNEVFRKKYLSNLDFNLPVLTRSPVYTDIAFKYIFKFARRGLPHEVQQQEFIYAVDSILHRSKGNDLVYNQMLDYLLDGFEKLNLDGVLAHIGTYYSGSVCQSAEKSTLERKLLYQRMTPGTKAPNLILSFQNLKQVSLKDIAKKQNLLIFWSSQCPHCNQVIPEIKRITERLNYKEVNVITLSIDTDYEAWATKIREFGIDNFFNFCDLRGWDSEAAVKYNVFGTPLFFVTDKELNVIAKPKTVEEVSKLLEY